MKDLRGIIADALVEHLQWKLPEAQRFTSVWNTDELENADEHVRQIPQAIKSLGTPLGPIAGLATVLYQVRIRLADGYPVAIRRANAEAKEYATMLKAHPDHFHDRFDAVSPDTPPRVHGTPGFTMPWDDLTYTGLPPALQ